MHRLLQALRRFRPQFAIVASLAFATAICGTALVLRVVYFRSLSHIGLLWNLFLAWLPMIFSLAAYNFYQRHSFLRWLAVAACAFVWLIFFPNAPYITTDIMHLRAGGNVPLWYDLIMIVAFAWTGVFLGLVSLYLMQLLVEDAAGRVAGWVFALTALAASGFGVYLGRFERWNSWDVLFNPFSLLAAIWDQFRHPIANHQTFAFSVLFSLFFVSTYLMLMAVMQFRSRTPEHQG